MEKRDGHFGTFDTFGQSGVPPDIFKVINISGWASAHLFAKFSN